MFIAVSAISRTRNILMLLCGALCVLLPAQSIFWAPPGMSPHELSLSCGKNVVMPLLAKMSSF